MFGKRGGTESSVGLPLFGGHAIAVVDDAFDDYIGLFAVAFNALEHLIHATVETGHTESLADRVSCALVFDHVLVSASDCAESQQRQAVLTPV